MATIDIRKTHRHDLATAQQIADDLARDLAEKFSVNYGWDDDVLLFERSGCNGSNTVSTSTPVSISSSRS